MCIVIGHVRFTPESGRVRCIYGCLLCAKSGHTSVTCPPPVGKSSPTSSPLISASGDAHLGAVSPDALLVPGRADGRARTVATGSLRQPGFAQAVFVSGEIFRTTER